MRAKYGNSKVFNSYGKFDSRLEASRYLFLLDAEKRGLIKDIKRQVKFVLIPKQERTEKTEHVSKTGRRTVKTKTVVVERECSYLADFVYWIKSDNPDVTDGWVPVVEDTKGLRMKEYIIKRKLMRQQGYPIYEVNTPAAPIPTSINY